MSALTFARACSSIAVGLVLILAGLLKLRNVGGLSLSQGALGQFPGVVRRLVAGSLPWIELGVGASCLAARGWLWPQLFVAVLLSVFTLSMVVPILKGDSIRCGCFGEGDSEVPPLLFLSRNAALIGMALFAAGADLTILSLSAGMAASVVAMVALLSSLVVTTHLRIGSMAR